MISLTTLNIITSVFAGGVSALIGASIYHYVDKVKTRNRLKVSLLQELKINLANLNREKDRIESGTTIFSRFYYIEVYSSLRLLDPELLFEISEATDYRLVVVYDDLNLLNMATKATNYGLKQVTPNMAKPIQDTIENTEKLIDILENSLFISRKERLLNNLCNKKALSKLCD